LFRTQLGLPPLDKETAREIAGPGGGGMVSPGKNVGTPKTQGSRQKPLPPSGTPKGNYGGDRTGG
jgi:hypothetical protein